MPQQDGTDRSGRPREGSETILVVEDDPAVRDYAMHVLKSRGYAILDAGNGAEAFTLAVQRAGAIDMVVTDVLMPEMGGLELARRLRTTMPQFKILFMSGYVGPDFVIEEGFGPNSDFVQKPFSPSHLSAKVRALLDQD